MVSKYEISGQNSSFLKMTIRGNKKNTTPDS